MSKRTAPKKAVTVKPSETDKPAPKIPAKNYPAKKEQ